MTQLITLTAKSSLQRDVMDTHRLLCHAHQGMLRDTAKVAGITPTEEGVEKQCVSCSKYKPTRFIIPKTTNERADEPLGRVFCDLAGTMKHLYVGGNKLCDDVRERLHPHKVENSFAEA